MRARRPGPHRGVTDPREPLRVHRHLPRGDHRADRPQLPTPLPPGNGRPSAAPTQAPTDGRPGDRDPRRRAEPDRAARHDRGRRDGRGQDVHRHRRRRAGRLQAACWCSARPTWSASGSARSRRRCPWSARRSPTASPTSRRCAIRRAPAPSTWSCRTRGPSWATASVPPTGCRRLKDEDGHPVRDAETGEFVMTPACPDCTAQIVDAGRRARLAQAVGPQASQLPGVRHAPVDGGG